MKWRYNSGPAYLPKIQRRGLHQHVHVLTQQFYNAYYTEGIATVGGASKTKSDGFCILSELFLSESAFHSAQENLKNLK